MNPVFRRGALASALALAAPLAVQAANLNSLQLLDQGEFHRLAEDLGAVASHKPLSPSDPLGWVGFDLGVAVSGTELQNRDVWRKASLGASVPSTLPVPSLRAIKGLPFSIDVGVSYSGLPDVSGSLLGAELRWAFIEGGVATPAVALRLAGTRSNGIDQLDFSSASVDVSISKGFAFATPYAGIGSVRSSVKPRDLPTLASETITQAKFFAGVNFNLLIGDILLEADRTGDATTFSAKLGYRF
ncbi:hypothetical protein [Rivibacter subsaxonicus]|uniref:Outer membrane beta-barrel porin/alpha-amylase n=1 Tax=Rivibacter subsaxonicus TaxID=457575 RepID=A0A4Q7VFY4_9BURK|nr:hypothetical protein [Rivibacter subsaxonicus]RZT94913.1 hypothetical protein EV670_2658 [Rivibacter subsaxonicus]